MVWTMARKPAFLSHTPEREGEIHNRLLDVLTARFRRKIADEITRESLRIAQSYIELGQLPPVDDGHYKRMRALYYQMDLACVRTFGSRVLSAGVMAGRAFTVDGGKSFSFNLERKELAGFAAFFEALANTFINLEAVRRRITSVSDTTRADIVRQVERGQRDGLGVAEIGQAILDRTPVRSRLRANIIARTETHGAANYGAFESAKSTGLELEKTWLSSPDHRTRDFGQGDGVVDEFDHREMNGQTVGMDEPFVMKRSNGADVLCQYAGDPTLPAGAAINCRCTITYKPKDWD